MASATGIPDARVLRDEDLGEDEPLLGRIGDASQHATQPLHHNLIIGTAVIAQAGVVLLVASVWANVFLHPLILFSAHPLLNSTAVLLLVQAILILQPTHTAPQKKRGTLAHFAFNSISINLLLAGLVIIEYNKFAHKGTHFVSPHAILGLITYILIFSQSVIGSTAYFMPKIYGSEDKAKSLYKWHRLSGYLILLMLLATVAAATQTDYSKNVLHIRLWSTLVASVLILVGVVPRIKKGKFGFGNRRVLQSGAFGQ